MWTFHLWWLPGQCKQLWIPKWVRDILWWEIVYNNVSNDKNNNNSNIQSCMSSHLELLYVLLLTFHFWISSHNTSVLKKKGNPDRKTFAMWKIARIGRGKNQKAWKQEIRRTPICYNVMIHYHSWQSIVNCQVHPSTSFHVTIMPCILGEIITKLPTFRHYTCLHKIHSQWTLENQIAWKTAGLISRKRTNELRCNGLEFCSRRISCFHCFWCLPRPIL